MPEGTPGAAVVAVKRVDELGFYNLGAKELADKLGISMNKAIAVVDHLGLRSDKDCYKEFKIGKVAFKRYSQQAIDKLSECLKTTTAEAIWAARKKTVRAKSLNL